MPARRPSGARVTNSPASTVAPALAACCSAAFTLMKPPRYRDSTALVIIVIAGENRPDMVTMNNAIINEATATEVGPSRVMMTTTTIAHADMMARSFSRSKRSLSHPMKGVLTAVVIPPTI
jgi:hypothetical protein